MAKKGLLTTSDYLPHDEYMAVVGKLHEDKLYKDELYFVIAFYTALRVSDLRMLKWEDVLDQSMISLIEKKTGKNRLISLNKEVRSKIYELYVLLEKPYKGWYIFQGSKQQPVTNHTINNRLKFVRDKYSLSIHNFSSHTFRKTFGRYVYESMNRSEESLLMLQRIFGHSNVGITYVYIGIRQDEINRIYESIKF